jgi:hypothetical protein
MKEHVTPENHSVEVLATTDLVLEELEHWKSLLAHKTSPHGYQEMLQFGSRSNCRDCW